MKFKFRFFLICRWLGLVKFPVTVHLDLFTVKYTDMGNVQFLEIVILGFGFGAIIQQLREKTEQTEYRNTRTRQTTWNF